MLYKRTRTKRSLAGPSQFISQSSGVQAIPCALSQIPSLHTGRAMSSSTFKSKLSNFQDRFKNLLGAKSQVGGVGSDHGSPNTRVSPDSTPQGYGRARQPLDSRALGPHTPDAAGTPPPPPFPLRRVTTSCPPWSVR